MAAYNGVNGSPMTQSPLLRDILHGEWGYDGLVMSDWTATHATEAAAQAALDLAMPGPASLYGPWGDALVEAVGKGAVDEALIDDKVIRILRLAARVGALADTPAPPLEADAPAASLEADAPAPPGPRLEADAPAPPGPRPEADAAAPPGPRPEADAAAPPGPSLAAPDSVAVAQELRAAAAAGFVLARNDGILPLARSGPADLPGLDRRLRVAVIGPNAQVARTMGGGSATVFPPYTISPLDGLRAAGLHVTYAPGVTSHLRAGEARAPWLLRPDRPFDPGTGAEIRFLSEAGELAGSELRDGATFMWLSGFTASGVTEPVARLEVRCVIRATVGGEYQLGVSGLGRYRLLVDGAEVFDATLALPENADIAEALMRPPQQLAPVQLAAGQSVAVVAEHDVHSSPFAGLGTLVQLNLVPPHGTDDEEIATAAALAAASEVAVVVVGTTSEVESEGFDRTTLALPGRQDELVRQVIAANPRTVVVVNSGAPVLLPWAQDAAAVLLSWFGGQEYGDALADVLLGDVEPGGRLPMTWPASEEGLPSTQPVDGVLTYHEGLFIGYRALRPRRTGTPVPVRSRDRLHHLGARVRHAGPGPGGCFRGRRLRPGPQHRLAPRPRGRPGLRLPAGLGGRAPGQVAGRLRPGRRGPRRDGHGRHPRPRARLPALDRPGLVHRTRLVRPGRGPLVRVPPADHPGRPPVSGAAPQPATPRAGRPGRRLACMRPSQLSGDLSPG